MASSIHTSGSKVWLQDPSEAWVKAEVVKVLPDGTLSLRLEDSNADKTCAADDCPLQNPGNRGVEVSIARALGARCARQQRVQRPAWAARPPAAHTFRGQPSGPRAAQLATAGRGPAARRDAHLRWLPARCSRMSCVRAGTGRARRIACPLVCR